MSIRCPAALLKAGDEVPIEFVIENKGTVDYAYHNRNYDRSGRMDEYALSAVDDQGHAVPDPRTKGLRIGGGLANKATLAPGQSFTKTIPLNRWALVTKPGRYTITGMYHRGSSGSVVAKPITVTIEPRTDEEMAAYIAALEGQLAVTEDGDAHDLVLEKLVYTCDVRAVPTLIEEMYGRRGNAGFWASEAFNSYLPKSKEVTDALLKAASERDGMAGGMMWVLKERGVSDSQIKSLIDVSLAAEHSDCCGEGALAAQQYPDDRFTPRLIAIAMDPNSQGRLQAIHALAKNRTDESVAALKKLLNEPDPIGRTTADAIRSAYTFRGNAQGRPLRQDDFPPELQKRK